MTVYVISHVDSDGMGAEVAAYHKFGHNATYLRMQYGQEFPVKELKPQDEIYILDFSWPVDILDKVNDQVRQLIVIDHHDDKDEEFVSRGYVIHDLSKSAAILAWEYFNPNQRPPRALLLIQDYDLWQFNYVETRAFEYGLKATKELKTVADRHRAFVKTSATMEKIIAQGSVIKNEVDNYIDYFLKSRNFKVSTFQGWRVAVLNTTTHRNELSERLYLDPDLGLDFVLCWSIKDEDRFVVSMRGKKGRCPNLVQIAKQYGGGGHPQAAAFNIPMKDGFELVYRIVNATM
jgi:oligoribonuclease NrnB/cAMP/cGMP phosphodiesterase (DHH superfamily)